VKGISFKQDVWEAKREILDECGRAQTRRAFKPQPIERVFMFVEEAGALDYWVPYTKNIKLVKNNQGNRKNGCGYYPRYKIGEIVYRKESYKFWCSEDDGWIVKYKDGAILFPNVSVDEYTDESFYTEPTKWKSPRYMPEWAARDFLQITGYGIQRVQGISRNDLTLEGTIPLGKEMHDPLLSFLIERSMEEYLRTVFARVWDSINKPPYDWKSNPWVWIYDIKLVDREAKC